MHGDGDAEQLGLCSDKDADDGSALNSAWNTGMMLRPSARSFAAPETFMATSHTLKPMPKKASAMMAPIELPKLTAMPAAGRPSTPKARNHLMVLRVPSAAMMWLEHRRPEIDPMAMPNTIMPISPGVAPSSSRTAGTRLSQLAMPKPARANTAKMAFRQAAVEYFCVIEVT